MKVLRKPRLNRTVVSVAVDTAASLSRALAHGHARPFLTSIRIDLPVPVTVVKTCKRLAMVLCCSADRRARPVDRHMPRLAATPVPVRGELTCAASSSQSLLATFAFARPAQAQEWPQRQVTIVVPFTAGGTTDMFGAHPRAGTAAEIRHAVHRREPRRRRRQYRRRRRSPRRAKDGYTLLVGTVSTHAINPFIYKNLAHDTEKDFQPVSLIARLPNMLVVNPKVPAKTVAELVEYLKKNPAS